MTLQVVAELVPASDATEPGSCWGYAPCGQRRCEDNTLTIPDWIVVGVV